MRSGVNRDGQHLYPTFPYDHFTNVTDEDDRALYAYLMTRQPVRAPARENQLVLSVQPARSWSRAGNCCSCATAPISPIASAKRGMESRRLSGRGAGPLRRLPHAAQCARRGTQQRAVRRRRCRQLARLCDQRPVARAGAMGCGRAVRISAPGLASRPRRRARADGAGGRQSVCGPAERRPRDRGLHGRRVRRADAGAQAPGRRCAGAGQTSGRPQAPKPTRRRRGDLCRGLRDLPCQRPGRCPMAGSISRSAPPSTAPIRATPPTSCCRASRPWQASAARSCPALPPA